MKLSISLFAAAVSGEEASSTTGDISPFLDALESYCIEAYGLPAFRTKPNETNAQWAARWTNRNGFLFLNSWPEPLLGYLDSTICYNQKPFKDAKNKEVVFKQFTTKWRLKELPVEHLIRK